MSTEDDRVRLIAERNAIRNEILALGDEAAVATQ